MCMNSSLIDCFIIIEQNNGASSHISKKKEWHATPYTLTNYFPYVFFCRFGGLSKKTLFELKSYNFLNHLSKINILEKNIDILSKNLIITIEKEIHHIKNDPLLKKIMHILIECRRAIHNKKFLKSKWLNKTHFHHSEKTYNLLLIWNINLKTLEKLHASSDNVYFEDIRHTMKNIIPFCEQENFRKGVQIANISFEKQIDSILKNIPQKHYTHKDRLRQRTLVRYLTRTSVKTSPFSTLGIIYHGDRFAQKNSKKYKIPENFTLNTRLNTAPLHHFISKGLRYQIETYAGVISLNPTLKLHSGRYYFIREKVRSVAEINWFGSLRDQIIFSCPHNKLTNMLVNELKNKHPRSINELSNILSHHFSLKQKQLRTILISLFDQGMIVGGSLYAYGNYTATLELLSSATTTTPWESATRSLLSINDASYCLSKHSITKRRQLLIQAQETMLHTFKSLPNYRWSTSKSSILLEDAIGNVRVPAPEGFDQIIASLSTLQKFIPLFDRILPLRIAFMMHFENNYGQNGICHNVSKLCSTFVSETIEPFQRNRSQFYKSTSPLEHTTTKMHGQKPAQALKKALKIKQLSQAYLRKIARKNIKKEHIELDIKLVKKLQAYVPSLPPNTFSNSFSIQETDNSPNTWVLNKIYGGNCQLSSRFLINGADNNAVRLAHTDMKDYLKSTCPPNAIYAEIYGNNDTNLNLHPCLLDHQIIIHPDQSPNTTKHNFFLNDLGIKKDATKNELILFCRKTGQRIMPVYLGGQVDFLLPSLQQALLLFGPTMRTAALSWEELLNNEEKKFTTSSPQVRAMPRINIEDLTILRATWIIPAELLPNFINHSNDTKRFIELRHWAASLSLPTRSFVKPLNTTETTAANPQMSRPTYLDLDSALIVESFFKALKNIRTGLVMTEALPDPNKGNPSDHVTEYVVDITSQNTDIVSSQEIIS